jgi:hypothetical protein
MLRAGPLTPGIVGKPQGQTQYPVLGTSAEFAAALGAFDGGGTTWQWEPGMRDGPSVETVEGFGIPVGESD